VRVIDENGEQLGVLPLAEAVKRAQDQGLDLVAVSLQANPPVTKIVEYAKFLYDQKQREKRVKQHTKEVDLKELRFGPNIGDHDLEVRINRAKEFLGNGDKVKINVQFKGRMITHQDVGRTKVQKMLVELQDDADIERGPYQEGRSLYVLLQPKKK
jgi:translation initiation factor IF-3